MNCIEYLKPALEAYRGNDLAPGSLDVDEDMEGSTIHKSLSSADTKAGEKTSTEEKRDQRIELWMNDIKSFIRNIDIGSL